MKRGLLSFLLVMTCIFTYANGYEAKFSQPSNNEYQISFELKDWNLINVEYEDVNFQQIIFGSSVATEEKGWAELPFISASVQLPAKKNVDLSIVYTDYTDYQLDYPLVPSRGTISRSQDPSTIPYEIDPASIIDAFYPNQLAIAEDPFIIRDVRGTAVRVFPFHYNAVTKTLRVYSKVDVLLTENNKPAINPLLKENATPVKEAVGMYQSIFLNFNTAKYDLPITQHGEILVITTSRDSETIDTYINWKKEMGYVVHKEIVATGTNVKSLIQSKYNANNNILYVQLVGDYADIKCDYINAGSYGNKVGDADMGRVVGNDYYPEVAIGRFSCSNASELNVQINKTINYEKNPNMDPNWRESFLGTGGSECGGDDSECDYTHIQRIYSQRLQSFTYNTTYEYYQTTMNASQVRTNITTAINSGVSTFAHTAHGDWDGFYFNGNGGGTVYHNSNVNQLTNGDKLPFLVPAACYTGDFATNQGNCFGETWLKKEGGGAVVVLMSSISQPWTPPMRGQDYFYDILTGGYDYTTNLGNGLSTTEQRTTWGSIVVNTFNLMLTESSASTDHYTTRTWNTFGDVSLQLRTKQPDVITSSASSITAGTFSTTITKGGAPIKDALVCISQNGTYVSAFTNASGQVNISHSFTSGNVRLVVTAFNTTTIYTNLSFGGTTTYTIAASANPAAGGSITGAGSYNSGATATLTATANSSYTFVNWTENGSQVSTSATYSFTVTANRTLVANFTAQPTIYTIVASANPAAGGSITGAGSYNSGATATLTATANSGYTFVNWTENGSQVSTSATYSFTVTANRILVANFTAQPTIYTIAASANPTAGGSITGAGTYNSGATVTVVATANQGYDFVNWTENGNIVYSNPSYAFIANKNRNLVANFSLQSFTINATALPVEGGQISGTGTFNYGAIATLTATANTGYTFANWVENGSSISTNATYNFTVTENRTLTAVFTINTYTVTVDIPFEGGIVTGDGTYNHGESVTLTAIPDIDFIFENWIINREEEVVEENPYTFIVTANMMITANFKNTIGIDEIFDNTLIYPNPVDDIVRIENTHTNIEKIQVYNIVGGLVYEREAIKNKEATIDMSGFTSGIYFVKVDSQILKLVKK
jgi:hypothetical protein